MSADCIFCRIAQGEIPATKLYEDEEVIAFKDLDPKAPTHLLIIPVKHISDMNEAGSGDQALLGKMMLVARNLAKQEGIDQSGYRFVLNTGPDGGQAVFHIHLHLLGGRQMNWPPG